MSIFLTQSGQSDSPRRFSLVLGVYGNRKTSWQFLWPHLCVLVFDKHDQASGDTLRDHVCNYYIVPSPMERRIKPNLLSLGED